MTDLEAIRARHSVRNYLDKPIPAELRAELDGFVASLNAESALHIRIFYDDPAGFDSRLAHYGSFRNVANYIILAGKKEGDFDFRCGYYGEKLVLFAQKLGLNTCWAALTFNKKRVRELVPEGESLCMVIALGFGAGQGTPHRGKDADKVTELSGPAPDWFRNGVEAALLAPTAVNQQKFCFSLEGEEPVIRVKGLGTCTRVDLGIAALHFELASGRKVKAK